MFTENRLSLIFVSLRKNWWRDFWYSTMEKMLVLEETNNISKVPTLRSKGWFNKTFYFEWKNKDFNPPNIQRNLFQIKLGERGRFGRSLGEITCEGTSLIHQYFDGIWGAASLSGLTVSTSSGVVDFSSIFPNVVTSPSWHSGPF